MTPSLSPTSSVVWVVEHCDYAQSCIRHVADSVEAAVSLIKVDYPAPYKVRWESPTADPHDGIWSLVGHFEKVPGYSTEHTASWAITSYEVEPSPSPAESSTAPSSA